MHTKEEVVAHLNTILRPARPQQVEAVADFVMAIQNNEFDAEKAAVELKQAQIAKLEERKAALEADVASVVSKRPELKAKK